MRSIRDPAKKRLYAKISTHTLLCRRYLPLAYLRWLRQLNTNRQLRILPLLRRVSGSKMNMIYDKVIRYIQLSTFPFHVEQHLHKNMSCAREQSVTRIPVSRSLLRVLNENSMLRSITGSQTQTIDHQQSIMESSANSAAKGITINGCISNRIDSCSSLPT